MALANTLRVHLEIKTGNTYAAFKYDGKRFLNSDSTVKLVEGTEYDLTLVFQKPVKLKPGSSRLRVYLDVEQEPEPLELVDVSGQGDQGQGRSVLRCSWTCRLPVSKKESRAYVNLDVEVQDFGKISLPMVVKVYRPNDPSSRHGFDLRYIQFEFKPDPVDYDPARTQLQKFNYFRL